MTAHKDQPAPKENIKTDLHALVVAIAKANGHPDPEAFAADVRKHLEAK